MKSVFGASAVITLLYFLLLGEPSAFAQFNNQRRQVRQNCITPENYYGSCVALRYCPQVVNVFQSTSRERAERYVIALQRSCGTRNFNGDPVLCCTSPQNNPQTTERPSNPFFPKEQPFVGPQPPPDVPNRNPFLTTQRPPTTTTTTTTTRAPVTSAAPLVELRGPVCRGPDTKPGNCVDIKSCPLLLNQLIAKQKDSTFVSFLQASQRICGNVGSTVCCPNGQTATNEPVVTPTVSTEDVPRRLPNVEEGCGYTLNTFKKIVGGEVSRKGAWPWIALLGYDDPSSSPFKCGGTLITARHVLTAAHCIRQDLIFVRLGEHDLSTDTETRHVDINVIRYVSHPEYNRQNGRSDIAILYLERNVQFTDKITPICLPHTPQLRGKSYVGYMPFVAGWGKTQEGGESATVLNELQIPIFDNEQCRESYAKQKRYFSADQFDSAVVCAGVLTGGKDTCQGDSGGPLMIPEPYQNSVRFYLIGVVSYGIGCARPEVPGVYSSTQYFMDWIIERVQETT
ncbi:venom serine protease Bi-VSP isoform X1 [Drosophila pseudoobscura]|uniref:CLIP domain-containing serine protease n=1 Tax=Drosophila pseudoobscura pseudoobscura TaxID=46245 RepID=A0A6I8UBU8_DROPS|nr:venom serine protease Bi-VSP isoform X1 [Drosophila pseudoobscura]